MVRHILIWVLLALFVAGCARPRAPQPVPQKNMPTPQQETARPPQPALLYDDVYPPYPPEPPPPAVSPLPLAVILDPGHGGMDGGANVATGMGRLCEDELNQDVCERLAAHSQRLPILPGSGTPAIHIVQTVVDRGYHPNAFTPCDNGQNEFLNHPDGTLGPIATQRGGGLDQRAQIIDAWYEHLLRQGFQPDRIVLVSIHFDAAAAYMRGAFMLYPGLVYDQQKRYEVDRPDRHTLPRTWTSLEMGTYLMDALEQNGIPLHQHQLGGDAYLFQGYLAWRDARRERFKGRLAIFAHTTPMPKILIEVANLNHGGDLDNAMNEDFRQRVADALWKGLVSYSALQPYRDIPY